MRIFQKIHGKLNWSRRRYISAVIGLLAIGYLSSAIYHTYKPLPQGLDYTGKLRHAKVQFIADQSYADTSGKLHLDQQIFKQMLMVAGTRSLYRGPTVTVVRWPLLGRGWTLLRSPKGQFFERCRGVIAFFRARCQPKVLH